MISPENWPAYDLKAPPDYIFALGAISVNYARFEYAFVNMFRLITGANWKFAGFLAPRITNETKLGLMGQMRHEDWPKEILERSDHFVNGAAILIENRNLLMHSNLEPTEDGKFVLTKPKRKEGYMLLCEIRWDQLRRVADDLEAFRAFGHLLSVHISFKFGGGTMQSMLPDLPQKPISLGYIPMSDQDQE